MHFVATTLNIARLIYYPNVEFELTANSLGAHIERFFGQCIIHKTVYISCRHPFCAKSKSSHEQPRNFAEPA